nr:glycosyltransferase [Lachnospiraceae bacterium]
RVGKHTEFKGAIHETLQGMYLPVKTFEAYVHHFGYAYKNDEERRRKNERNYPALLRELEKNPDDLQLRAQVAMEIATFDNEKAYSFCNETLEKFSDRSEKAGFQYQVLLIFRLFEPLEKSYEEAVEIYKKLTGEYKLYETVLNAISLLMARLCILRGKNAEAYKYAEDYFKSYNRIKNDERIKSVELVGDMARYTDRPAYLEMLEIGAFSAAVSGRINKAFELYSRMPWEDKGFDRRDILVRFFSLESKNPRYDIIFDVIKKVMQNDTLKPYFSEMLRKEPYIKNYVNLAMQKMKEGYVYREETEVESENDNDNKEVSFVKSDIKLSVAVMVSKKSESVNKCLASINKLLEKVKGELIVLDTRPEDPESAGKEAFKYTDKVYGFNWIKNFSAARNECLKHVNGEWFLFLDDDEWIEEPEKFAEFLNKEESKYNSAMFRVKNYTEQGCAQSDVMRLARRSGELHFEGRVHEQLKGVYAPCAYIDTGIGHSGYYYTTKEEAIKHQERNMALLEEDLKDNPYSEQTRAQIVQELVALEETRRAGYDFCVNSISLLREKGLHTGPAYNWLISMSVKSLLYLEKYYECIKQAEIIAGGFMINETAEMVIAYCLVQAGSCIGNYPVVTKETEVFINKRNWLLEHETERNRQSFLDNVEFFSMDILKSVLDAGIKAAEGMNDKEKALDFKTLLEGKNA